MSGNKQSRALDVKCDSSKSEGLFMSGVAALTVSTVIVKLIGVLYKIPMLKLLGDEGMGYFNSAYEIYSLFYILATAGLPIAVSILVAECGDAAQTDLRASERVFRVALIMFSALGALGGTVLLFGARPLAELIENSGAALCIAAISPMAVFICLSSAVRGYFQGKQDMVPTAVSQIIEAGGKLVLGFLPAALALKMGRTVEETAALATLGMSVGAGISALYLAIAKFARGRRSTNVIISANPYLIRQNVAKRLLRVAFPITVSATVMSLTRVIDLLMIMHRLQSIGYTESAANSIYGSYSTLAVSMFNLPASLVTPIALSLVPSITSAVKEGNKTRELDTLDRALKLCGFITIPASLGLSVFARPILELVFYGETDSINVAAPLLSVLGISVFFSCIMTVTNSALQAYGKERKPIISMLIGATVKTATSYILIGIPSLNVYGAPISTLVCSLTVAAINMSFLKKCASGVGSADKLFLKTLAAAIVSIGSGGAVYALLYGMIGKSILLTAASIAASGVGFVFLSFRFGAIDRSDILSMPLGEKIYKILIKTRLIK